MTDNILYVLLKYSKRCSIGEVLLARDALFRRNFEQNFSGEISTH